MRGASAIGTLTCTAAAQHDLAALNATSTLPYPAARSSDLLRRSAILWLIVMLIGQWAFGTYIVAFYGTSLVTGDFESWNRLAALGARPFKAGDDSGNAAFLAHARGAGWIAFAGALQLVPAIRARFPRFHRWNGRIFLAMVTALSLSGFYLVWVRGTSPSAMDGIATSINGVLILGFAALAYRAVRGGDLAAHRRWAMRLYLVANAQWFLRIGFFAFFILASVTGLPPEVRKAFFLFWKFGCFLVPLALLQVYFHAYARPRGPVRTTTAVVLLAACAVMALGIVAFGGLSYKIVTGAPLSLG